MIGSISKQRRLFMLSQAKKKNSTAKHKYPPGCSKPPGCPPPKPPGCPKPKGPPPCPKPRKKR
ncbi:hypothetical protein SBA6_1230007 [Candidatus Sulfopaludibacter sp. SbA6]|nr:hypothetical protein SBA6_1230007 [Candidatus Sulfopaludibacter sp. SbA6]